MTESGYENPVAARTYDLENSGRSDFDFYLDLAGELSRDSAGDFAVLDIGCGTGALGVDLAEAGYRVTGVDPAQAMLDVARSRPGGDRVTWIHGYAGDVGEGIADLAIMTGHVAQYFITDEAWAEVLRNAYHALRPGGRLAFESRNVGDRAWERWVPEHSLRTVPHPDGGDFTTWHELVDVDEDATGAVIETHRSVTEYAGSSRTSPDETLIFRPLARLKSTVEAAGFSIERSYGDWTRGPITAGSVENILIARRP